MDFARHWYRPVYSAVTILLLPLAWLFQSIVAVRRFLYRTNIKKSYRFPVPVIVVGNITVGGTGKTPFVVWLAKLLKEQGFQPGVVSRGVGGEQQRAPRWVSKSSDPKKVGDEAILLAVSSDCPVVIGIDRVAAVTELLAKTKCNIVISDDGLQHYRLGRDIEIAIIDGERGFGNKCFLPAGPLRESPARLKEVDFIVQQGGGSSGYCFTLIGDTLVAVNNEQQRLPLTHFHNTFVHAVAGIGNPVRFFRSLRQQGLTVMEHVFPDHYLYQATDLDFGDKSPIIMTEKDAVKCREFADERYWYLPVVADMDAVFVAALLKRITQLGEKHA